MRHEDTHKRTRTITLTARSIGTIRPERSAVDWFDNKTNGLSILVTPAGARTWYLLYRSAGTARRVKLGTWPALGLADARTLAQDTRRRIETQHADPAYERRAARTAVTIGELAPIYVEQYAKPKKKTWNDDRIRLHRYIVRAWGSRAVTAITRADVHALLDEIGATKPSQARAVRTVLSKMFNFAIDRSYTEVNPCARMGRPNTERARETVLDNVALQRLWQALDASPGRASDAIRMRLLTGQRGGEVHAMRWADLEHTPAGWVWAMPAGHTKNGRAHRVPLPAAAEAILARRQDARGSLVLTGRHTRSAIAYADLVFGGLRHGQRDLEHLAAIHAGAYRWHDLRRTVTSRLAGLGIAEDVISRILNHAKKGITATVYNQYAYDAEKRAALETWAAELGRIVRGPASVGVLAFRREGAL